MKCFTLTLVSLLLAALVFPLWLIAESPLETSPPIDRYAIGFDIGYAHTGHDSEVLLRIPDDPMSPGAFGEEQSGGLSAGLTLVQYLGPDFSPYGSLSVSIAYLDAGVDFVLAGEETQTRVVSDETDVITSLTRFVASVEYSLLTTELLFNYFVPGTGLSVFAGPQLATPMNAKIKESYELVLPSEAKFPPDPDPDDALRYSRDDRSISFPERSLPEETSLLYFVKGGLMYELRMEGLSLAPYLSTSFALNDLSGSVNWTLWTLQTGVRVMHPF